MLVDSHDQAFKNPTKPVGPFYTAKEAQQLRQSKGWHIISDSGRGYRRVVPSPTPLDILEKETITRLFDTGTVGISVGGGGVPVIRGEDGRIRGVEAGLDKDRKAALLANNPVAETILIPTDSVKVFINYGKHDTQ